jgi:hypothetical protein
MRVLLDECFPRALRVELPGDLEYQQNFYAQMRRARVIANVGTNGRAVLY